jgi:hypothetical protein
MGNMIHAINSVHRLILLLKDVFLVIIPKQARTVSRAHIFRRHHVSYNKGYLGTMRRTREAVISGVIGVSQTQG